MSFVLDSSVALSWCFKDEQTPETLLALEMARTSAIFVPSFWHVEIANVLGIAARRGRVTEADLSIAIRTLDALEIRTDIARPLIGPSILIPLMQTYELTAYDATYLELAMRLNLPLATLVRKLISAAKQARLHVVGVSH